MRNLSRPLFVVVAILFAAIALNAQGEIAEEKRKLISELMTMTKADQQMAQTTDLMLASLESSNPETAKSIVSSIQGLTPEQRKEYEEKASKALTSISKTFRERLAKEIDYSAFIQKSIVPIYDRLFSIDELRAIVKFYKTPAGAKIIETTPVLVAEVLKVTTIEMYPQVSRLIEEITKKELDGLLKDLAARPAPPAKRARQN